MFWADGHTLCHRMPISVPTLLSELRCSVLGDELCPPLEFVRGGPYPQDLRHDVFGDGVFTEVTEVK